MLAKARCPLAHTSTKAAHEATRISRHGCASLGRYISSRPTLCAWALYWTDLSHSIALTKVFAFNVVPPGTAWRTQTAPRITPVKLSSTLFPTYSGSLFTSDPASLGCTWCDEDKLTASSACTTCHRRFTLKVDFIELNNTGSFLQSSEPTNVHLLVPHHRARSQILLGKCPTRSYTTTRSELQEWKSKGETKWISPWIWAHNLLKRCTGSYQRHGDYFLLLTTIISLSYLHPWWHSPEAQDSKLTHAFHGIWSTIL